MTILVFFQVVLQLVIINTIRPLLKQCMMEADTDTVVEFVPFMAILILLYSVATILVAWYAASVSSQVASGLRKDMFDKILSLKRPADSGANTAGLMTRMVSDVATVQQFMSEFLSVGLFIPMLAVGITLMAARLSISLCIAMSVSFALVIAVTVFMARKEVRVRSRLKILLDRVVYMFKETVSGARTIRAFGMEEEHRRRFEEANIEIADFGRETEVRMSYISYTATMVLIVLVTAIFGMMSLFGHSISVSSTMMVMFVQYAVLFITCASITPFIVNTMPSVRASIGRISKVMNAESEGTGISAPEVREGPLVECSNGMVIGAGEDVSVVGPSGSGRTEFIRALFRLDDVAPGEFSFGGIDISEIDPVSLRRRMAYAGDLAKVFDGTVRQNIALNRRIPDARLEEAMAVVCLDIDLDVRIGKSGRKLSAGEIQKISVARALVTDASLYVFDDCFTELDPQTESVIVSNIRTFIGGRAMLFSSHDLRIARGSAVAVMQGGRVVDRGSHADLLSRCDLYRSMYEAGGGGLE